MDRRQFLSYSIAAAATAQWSTSPLAAAERFELRSEDVVVFLGDSITEQRRYTTYLESYYLTRYPLKHLTFRNVGWGGDTAWLRQRARGTDASDTRLFALEGADQQAMLEKMVRHGLERDVFSLQPTVVLAEFGMNDARRGEAALPVYQKALREIVTQVSRAKARPVLLSTSPEEGDQAGVPGGSAYNAMLGRYTEAARQVASDTGTPFVDQFHPYLEVVDAARKKDAGFRTIPDGVHPSPAGHLLMAWAILKGLGADPLVSEVSLDVSGKVAGAARAQVSEVSAGPGSLAFTRYDEALPMPLPKEAAQVLPLAPILETLSRLSLRVSGLPAERYDLLIDGDKVAVVTRGELQEGCNLSGVATPMSAQATRLMEKVVEKNNAFSIRWRSILVPALVDNRAGGAEIRARLAEADRKLAALEREVEALRRPVPHRFELRPLT